MVGRVCGHTRKVTASRIFQRTPLRSTNGRYVVLLLLEEEQRTTTISTTDLFFQNNTRLFKFLFIVNL
jgi:hypothetical protein